MSVDGHNCHSGWALSMGGISYPMLADFHPKGEVGRAYGVYAEDYGFHARATVFIDASGVVRFAEPVERGGERDMDEFATLAEKLASEYAEPLSAAAPAPGVPEGTRLFVKNSCGPSRAAIAARTNLHLEEHVPLVNVSEDPKALAELERLSGKQQAPCLLLDGSPLLEARDIVRELVTRATGVW